MSAVIPLWRRLVGRVDDVVTPAAEALVRSDGFAVAAGLVHRFRREVGGRVERSSRRAWHLVNLPAGSDVNRLLAQLGSLERQVRDLEKRLGDAAERERSNGDAPGPRRAARPRPA